MRRDGERYRGAVLRKSRIAARASSAPACFHSSGPRASRSEVAPSRTCPWVSHSAITSLMKAMAAHRRHIVADGCYGVRMCRSEARCCSARNDDKWPIAADFGPAAVVARLVRDPAEHEAKRLRISAIITFVGRGSWQAARPVAPPGDSTDATRPPTPFHRALPLLYWLRHPRQVQWSCRSVRSSRELPASATECR